MVSGTAGAVEHSCGLSVDCSFDLSEVCRRGVPDDNELGASELDGSVIRVTLSGKDDHLVRCRFNARKRVSTGWVCA